jgi:hypothetical protein
MTLKYISIIFSLTLVVQVLYFFEKIKRKNEKFEIQAQCLFPWQTLAGSAYQNTFFVHLALSLVYSLTSVGFLTIYLTGKFGLVIYDFLCSL